jgi:hypothetical protein
MRIAWIGPRADLDRFDPQFNEVVECLFERFVAKENGEDSDFHNHLSHDGTVD